MVPFPRAVAAAFTALLIAPAVPAAEPDLAAKLKGVAVTQYAKAPGYSEGPTWKDGELFFCSGALLRVTKDGTVEKHLSINPAGTALRGDGHLLICDNKNKALLDLAPDGKLGVLADACAGKPLGSLNDLTVDARGNVYWTDPENSGKDKPVGRVFRVTPAGVVSEVAGGLAFPNGLDVDPAGKFLYVVESQSKKILRYAVPADDQPCGKAEEFYDLGGSGGDGCAFDAAGNLWVADYHRPDTKKGRVVVLSPAGKLLATLDVPAEAVSNVCFGGTNHDELFCTTGGPPGVFQAKVGVKGFKGHAGKPGKVVRELKVALADPASPVHPRRFGTPGGVGGIRGWYVWQKWDPATGIARVTKDPPGGEVYTVRVLPWATTYRHLAYGATPDDLLPGERVNLFFSPDEVHPRGYLVHYQDEIGQMKGHNHAWEVLAAEAGGTRFTARVVDGDKPLTADPPAAFELDSKCVHWRGGKVVRAEPLKAGERVYLTWCWRDGKRVAALTADDASLDALKKEQEAKLTARAKKVGIAGQVDAVEGSTVRYMAYATYWAQAAKLKPGDAVRLAPTGRGEPVEATVVSLKNRGTYGSGVTDFVLELTTPADAKAVAGWPEAGLVRLVPR